MRLLGSFRGDCSADVKRFSEHRSKSGCTPPRGCCPAFLLPPPRASLTLYTSVVSAPLDRRQTGRPFVRVCVSAKGVPKSQVHGRPPDGEEVRRRWRSPGRAGVGGILNVGLLPNCLGQEAEYRGAPWGAVDRVKNRACTFCTLSSSHCSTTTYQVAKCLRGPS